MVLSPAPMFIPPTGVLLAFIKFPMLLFPVLQCVISISFCFRACSSFFGFLFGIVLWIVFCYCNFCVKGRESLPSGSIPHREVSGESLFLLFHTPIPSLERPTFFARLILLHLVYTVFYGSLPFLVSLYCLEFIFPDHHLSILLLLFSISEVVLFLAGPPFPP